jgi:hypothetical protein
MKFTNLPVLGLALKHHGVLGLALVALIAILDLLGALLGLDAVILGKGALVAGSSGVGEEVRANGLDAALCGLGQLADGLEVLLCGPSAREGGEGECHGSHGSHGV